MSAQMNIASERKIFETALPDKEGEEDKTYIVLNNYI